MVTMVSMEISKGLPTKSDNDEETLLRLKRKKKKKQEIN